MKKKLLQLLFTVTFCAILLTACGAREPELMPNPKFEEPGSEQTEPSPDLQEPSAEPEENTDSEKYVTVSIDQLKRYMNESYGMMEFAQRLFDNFIVYKSSSGQYTYVPVNKDLPQSTYDFNNLVNVGSKKVKEFAYIEDGETRSIKGIDVSAYQGDIDWELVASSGVEYVFVRLGYRGYGTGKLVLDEKFEENARGAAEQGIGVGVYFVTQAVTPEEAKEEAQFVLDTIKDLEITWPVALDMEEAASADARTALLTNEERTDNCIAFCEEIKKAGYRPMLYTHIRWFIEELQLERLTEYDKWFAQYFNRPFFPYEFQIWQYSSTGRIDGIKGDVDYNIRFVDYGNKEAEHE